jgi:ABC-type transport system substrate-binding protein
MLEKIFALRVHELMKYPRLCSRRLERFYSKLVHNVTRTPWFSLEMNPKRHAVSRSVTIIGVLAILIIAVVAGIALTSKSSNSSSTTSSTGSGTSTGSSTSIGTSTSGAVPQTLTYESAETIQYLDPAVSYYSYDYNIMQNVYEPILWYNQANATDVIPWLAASMPTENSAGTQYQFTLRSGIKFADAEALNSSAVWFSINRALINDGSSPVGHGTQSSWLIQQLSNQSLSSFFNGAQTYGNSYVQDWLNANFIQVTGALTFNVNVMNPNVAFPYLFSNPIVDPVAPDYVMQHDLALWTASGAGYTLPYTTLSGNNFTAKAMEYFDDLSATCNSGSTPAGCGATYLNTAAQGSQAGTGPYTITSDDTSTNTITLAANPSYWGGPYQFMTPAGQKIAAQIKTVIFKFVADQTTREIDVQNAAKSNQAMAIDVESTNLYDVASKSDWLNSGTLNSTINGVSLYGPYPFLGVTFDPFSTNVTSPLTGAYYSFQPFADLRLRTAFADAVNMTSEWVSNADKLGQVAPNVVPPGLPPAGVFNASIAPTYSYNPDESANLLLLAMQNPLRIFHFTNGTLAPAGLFNNTFGCTTLTNGKCTNPVAQTIQLVYATGDTSDEAIMNDIAGTINNVSSTYNMGLTVSVQPLPAGQELTEAFSEPNHLYMYAFGWIDDYPWVLDFTGNMLAYPGTYPGPDGMNFPAITNLYHESLNASSAGNLQALISDSNQMNVLSNQEVMYLWTFDNVNFVTMTSNVHGLYWNSNLGSAAANGVGPEYFATLY